VFDLLQSYSDTFWSLPLIVLFCVCLQSYSETFWDYIKAFSIWGLGWAGLILYFSLSALNQLLRRYLYCT